MLKPARQAGKVTESLPFYPLYAERGSERAETPSATGSIGVNTTIKKPRLQEGPGFSVSGELCPYFNEAANKQKIPRGKGRCKRLPDATGLEPEVMPTTKGLPQYFPVEKKIPKKKAD